jgi:hypothetical protein
MTLISINKIILQLVYEVQSQILTEWYQVYKVIIVKDQFHFL